jgi:DHA3 family macrolide efflux protein-like MFS transporter
MATQFSEAEGRRWKPPFFTIWSGQAVSLLGSQLVQFALIWHLTVTTGSAKVLAFAAFVALLPPVFLGPFIGSLVDRWNRRWIMAIADSVIALATAVLLVLFASGQVQTWHVYLLMFVRAVGGGFHQPAMSASTSLMVPREQMTRVQAINQTLQGGLNIVSAPLGAFLYETLSVQSILAIDIVSALFAIVPLFFIAIPQPARIESGESSRSSMLEDVKIGLRYVGSWPGLLIILGMATMINSLLNPASALMPLLIKEHFGGGAQELGWFDASFGLGVIVGGVLLGIWGGFKNKAATSMTGLVGIGVAFLALGFAPQNGFPLAVAASVFAGLMIPVTNGSIGAILQSAVAPDLQGRVFTLTGSAATAMSPIGLAVAGPVADAFGIQTWFWLGGVVCLAFGIAGFFIPALMQIEQHHQKKSAPEAALETVPGEHIAHSSVNLDK